MAKAASKRAPARPVNQLVIVDEPQGSEGWFKARAGLITASNFSIVLAEGIDGGPSLTRKQLLYRLAGERITGIPAEETFKSRAMERGKEMEPAAIADYERRRGVTVQRVGLAINFSKLKRCGASPDGLVGFDKGLETKTMRPDLMIPLLLNGAAMPAEHRAQVQGNMMVLERDLWDFKIFYPGMPDFTVTVRRDEVYIRRLHEQIEVFNHDLNRLEEKLRAMGAGQ